MSTNWAADLAEMHEKFGFDEWRDRQAEKLSWDSKIVTDFRTSKQYREDGPESAEARAILKKLLAFRITMMQEELNEITSAALVQEDPEEVVDGLIDIMVFALGTLHIFGVDANKAWDAIHEANMAKKAGVKPGRPNKFGLPDLLKPDGWTKPSHAGNHGILPMVIGEKRVPEDTGGW